MLFTEQQLIELNEQLSNESTEALVRIKVMLCSQFPSLNEVVWDRKYINDLPDAAFAAILPGGKKDKEGRTVPRSLRKLPHHTAKVSSPDDNSSVDLPHLRNALVRAAQPKTDLGTKKDSAISHLKKHAKALLPSYKESQQEKGEETIVSDIKYVTQEELKAYQETLESINKTLAIMQEELISLKVSSVPASITTSSAVVIDATEATTNTSITGNTEDFKQIYSQLELNFEELQKENKALIEEIEQLKAERDTMKESIHRGIAEQVVELKLELNKLLPDERENSLEEHLAREVSSLTDALNDLKNEKAELNKKVMLPEVKDPTLGADTDTELAITESKLESNQPEISVDTLDRAKKGCKEDLEQVKWFLGQYENRSKRR